MMTAPEDRLHALERRVHVLNKLAEISVVLNSTVELDVLLMYLMDAAASITDCEAASVLLWDDKANELRIAATTTHQYDLQLIGRVVPLEGSLAGQCFRTNQMVIVGDVASDPGHYDRLDREKQFVTRSLLAAPMRLNDRPIGVLEVINKRALPWTDDDRDYLSVLTAQASVAIGSARMIAELQRANAELSELDRMKNEFIAIASHELRTPLAIILGYASFLQDEAQGRLSEHAAKVMDSAVHLRQIIESLMNLRFLDQTADELVRETLPLTVVVQDALQDVRQFMDTSRHHLTLEVPDVPVHVDRIRMSMALTNVISNALRFTPEGGQITVSARLHDSQEVHLRVADTGIGLAPENLERIFERFVQVEGAYTRRQGGLGIGLSVARAMLRAHGGRIWAESAGLGQGAAFTLALPRG